jgi:hypothetical protein
MPGNKVCGSGNKSMSLTIYTTYKLNHADDGVMAEQQ